MTQCLSLRSWGKWICNVLKVFSLWHTEDCIIKSRECLFLALRNFTEELLFKPVLKQKHELPAGQEQKGIRGGDSLSKDREAFLRVSKKQSVGMVLRTLGKVGRSAGPTSGVKDLGLLPICAENAEEGI